MTCVVRPSRIDAPRRTRLPLDRADVACWAAWAGVSSVVWVANDARGSAEVPVES
jgi:hypothetical protein